MKALKTIATLIILVALAAFWLYAVIDQKFAPPRYHCDEDGNC